MLHDHPLDLGLHRLTIFRSIGSRKNLSTQAHSLNNFDLIDCIWTISKESLDLEFLDERAHMDAENSDLLLSKPSILSHKK